jgi:hypothetical protein
MNAKHLIGALVASTMLVSLSAGLAKAAPPNFQFGITIGDPPPPPPPPPGPKPHFPPPPPDDDCSSIKEIFSDLADQGYYKFRGYDDEDDDYFSVNARRGNKLYHLVVDSCDGDILSRKRIYQSY